MKLKKYGTFGLMEWKAVIKAGRATLHIHFTGGHDNEYGIIPATYRTSDPIIQHIIEHSNFFAEGKIRLVDEVDMGESPEEKEMRERKEREEKEKAKAKEPTAQAEPTAGNIPQDGKPTEGELTEVEVTCIDDAKNHLKEHFNEKPSSMRSKEAIESLAKGHGIVFRYTNE